MIIMFRAWINFSLWFILAKALLGLGNAHVIPHNWSRYCHLLLVLTIMPVMHVMRAITFFIFSTPNKIEGFMSAVIPVWQR